MGELKPCPFCGWQPPVGGADSMLDVLYPSGTWWREEVSWVPSKVTGRKIRTYHNHRSRKEGDRPCFEMNCTFNMGGCGARLVRDSREEAIVAWNTRPAPSEAEVEAAAKRLAVDDDWRPEDWDHIDYGTRADYLRMARAALGVEP